MVSWCLGFEYWRGHVCKSVCVCVRGLSTEPEVMSAGDRARGKPPMMSSLWVAESWLCFPAHAAVGLKEVHGFTHHSQSPPKISPTEKFTILGVNSGMKQNIAASMHSCDGHCNLRICAFMAFFWDGRLGGLFALRLSCEFCAWRTDFLLVWARSEFRNRCFWLS